MGGSWHFQAGARRWNWNKEPTFRCPNAELWTHDDGIRRRSDQLSAASDALGTDATLLAAILTHRHRSGGGLREKVDGRYTGCCRHCGARLIRLGFRGWIDETIPRSKMTDTERASADVSARIGGSPPRRAVGEGRYFDTKKQAEQWARASLAEAKR